MAEGYLEGAARCDGGLKDSDSYPPPALLSRILKELLDHCVGMYSPNATSCVGTDNMTAVLVHLRNCLSPAAACSAVKYSVGSPSGNKRQSNSQSDDAESAQRQSKKQASQNN